MRIVYMGTPDFAVPSLQALLENGYDVPFVVTRPDKRRDRGKKEKPTPVKALSEAKGIRVISPETLKYKDAEGNTIGGKANEEVMNLLREANPDCIVVAAYGQILPREILALPRLGCVNVHGSLLPRWRGAAPVQRAIEAGDETSGVTIMYMAEKLDAGEMLAKRETKTAGKTAGELTEELAAIGAELLIPTLARLERGELQPEAQNEADVTYAKMVFKKDGALDFTRSSEELERIVRAMNPWPAAYAYYKGAPFKILRAETNSKDVPKEGIRPGTIVKAGKDGVWIACAADENGNATEYLIATTIQLPGKKALQTTEFFKGNALEEGTILQPNENE